MAMQCPPSQDAKNALAHLDGSHQFPSPVRRKTNDRCQDSVTMQKRCVESLAEEEIMIGMGLNEPWTVTGASNRERRSSLVVRR
jgi:hypothetical protein